MGVFGGKGVIQSTTSSFSVLPKIQMGVGEGISLLRYMKLFTCNFVGVTLGNL